MDTNLFRAKSKAYFMICYCEEMRNGRVFSTSKAYRFIQQMGIDVSSERAFQLIAQELSEYDFTEYASILIFIELRCFHYLVRHLNDLVFNSFRLNSTLKNVTKFVLFYTSVNMRFRNESMTLKMHNSASTEPWYQIDFEKYAPDFIDSLRTTFQPIVPHDINNIVILDFMQLESHSQNLLDEFLDNWFQKAERTSLQELAQSVRSPSLMQRSYREVANFAYSSPGGCYVFNINPALVVVLNHQSFDNMTIRSVSSKDVQSLKTVFTQKKMKYVILKDGSLEDVKKLMRIVRSLRFTGLRHLILVVMSHGDEGDIIYTKTGSYSIRDDIVAPLLENPSLADTHITVLVNACRGGIDPRDVDCQAIATLAPSPREPVIYPKASNLVLMFSTQPGWISLRFDVGAIFIHEFCKVFGGDFAETTMERIGSEVKERMEYELSALYDCVQTPDYLSQDDAWRTSIKMQFENLLNHQPWLSELIEFLQKFFEPNFIDPNQIQ